MDDWTRLNAPTLLAAELPERVAILDPMLATRRSAVRRSRRAHGCADHRTKRTPPRPMYQCLVEYDPLDWFDAEQKGEDYDPSEWTS